MNYYKLGLGCCLLILSSLWLCYELMFNMAKKGDYARYYFKIKIYSGIVVLMLTGIYLIYKELLV